MKYYIGVDGGGSKTEFALSTGDRNISATLRRGGCSYHELGVEGASALLAQGVRDCLSMVSADPSDCGGCCIGVPCYGENPLQDSAIAQALQTALAPIPLYLTNDVEVGWAGALECRQGIHLVAGTGSIAFGRSEDGRTARCGGWNEFFGDEGSCYWVGRQAMSLFTKQADGRVRRGPLYDIVCKELALTSDYQFIDVILQDWAPHRDKVALFQRLAERAAVQGDLSAAALYQAAAEELVHMVRALVEKLELPPENTAVSYSGGLFKAGDLILLPLQKAVKALGCTLEPPKFDPVEGALMLAIDYVKRRA